VTMEAFVEEKQRKKERKKRPVLREDEQES
jgi:hypothetical protein